MNNIKEYIELAIENGFEEADYIWWISWNNLWHADHDYSEIYGEFVEGGSEDYKSGFTSIIDIITTKKFIEAIARGLVIHYGEYKDRLTTNKDKTELIMKSYIETEFEVITIKQAIAIRDNKLEEFIKNLLWTNNNTEKK